MPPARNRAREVKCPGCGGWFRVESRRGLPLPSAVPCPRCETRIPVERHSSEQFWVSKSHSQIFKRTNRGEEAGSETGGEKPEAPASSGEQPRGRGIDRTFRDVSEVRGEKESVLPDPQPAPEETPEEPASEPSSDDTLEEPVSEPAAGAEADSESSSQGEAVEGSGGDVPFEEYERRPPGADLEEFQEELELVAAEAAEDATGTPLPLPVQEDDQSAEGGSEQPAEEGSAPEETDGDEAGASERDPRPAAELATIPFADWERQWTGDVDAPLYDVRVHDTVREGVSIRDVVGLLEQGVWAGAVDVHEDGEWVPLPKHAAFQRLRSHLVDQSRQILLRREEGVDTSAESGSAELDLESGREGESEVESGVSQLEEPSEPEAEEPPPVPREGEGESRERDDAAPIDASDSGERESERADEAAEPEAAAAGGRGRRRLFAIAVAGLWVFGIIAATILILEGDEETRGAAGSRRASGTAERTGSDAGASETGDETPVTSGASPVAAARDRVRRALDPQKRARGYLAGGAYEAARRLAVRAMVERGVGRELRAIFNESIRRDESLVPTPVTIGVDAEVDAIHALGGGWSLSFRMTEGGESAFAFKPAQQDWERGWRAEIAAYHLCEVVQCHFEIPRNRPARIRKSRFMRLYERAGGELQRDYRDRFDQLEWRTEEGPEGETHEYLYGTLKDWVPDFVKFPIEYEMVWRPWLSGDTSPGILDRPLAKALGPLKKKGKEDFYESILEEKNGATTRSVAKQLSSILVFDFLTTNWDRFSTAEKFYGVNNQFSQGRFVSIDNGAAFSPHHFRVVTRRLAPVTRYSASTIASIRALKPSVVNPILFPNPTTAERRRLAVFWEQRDKLLDRVNGLIVEHGRETVFAFE